MAQNALFGLSAVFLIFPPGFSWWVGSRVERLISNVPGSAVVVTTVLRYALPKPPAPLPTHSGCGAIHPGVLDRMIENVASRHQVDGRVIRVMVDRESGGLPCVESRAGATGLLQLMPETARYLGVKNAKDPMQNIEGGTRLLKQLLVRYNNDLARALAAYNAGVGAVDQHRGVPPNKETQAYVGSILRAVSEME